MCVYICIYSYVCMYIRRLIGLVARMFACSPGNIGSRPGRVMLKTNKMVLDTSLLNTEQY